MKRKHSDHFHLQPLPGLLALFRLSSTFSSYAGLGLSVIFTGSQFLKLATLALLAWGIYTPDPCTWITLLEYTSALKLCPFLQNSYEISLSQDPNSQSRTSPWQGFYEKINKTLAMVIVIQQLRSINW